MKIRQKLASMSFDEIFLSLFALNLVLVVPFFTTSSSSMWFISFPFWCISPSLSALLAVWMSLSGRGRPWRIVAGFLTLLALAWCAKIAQSETAEWFFHITFWVMLFVMVPLLIIRLFRWSIQKVDHTQPSCQVVDSVNPDQFAKNETTMHAKPRYQFTLSTMLGWTTALAVVLGTLQGLPTMELNQYSHKDEAFIPLYAISLMVPFLVLSALGTQAIRIRGMALIFVIYVPMCLTCCVSIVFVPATLIIFAQLFVARRAGFRFVRATTPHNQ